MHSRHLLSKRLFEGVVQVNTLFKQTLTASILSTMIAGTAFAAPSEAPPDFIKRVADGLISRLKADHAKLQK